ncbi:MAG TPA: hypothetical protein VKR32_12765 [Puia sp.]|nr:hypothetical protein [Puia sp.]
MKLFPQSALLQLEFDKIRSLLKELCRTKYGKNWADDLHIYTEKKIIDRELRQAFEFLSLLRSGQSFPNYFTLDLTKELKLLSIPGAHLTGTQLIGIRQIAENAGNIFRWFKGERRTAYPALASILIGSYYERIILDLIDEVLDDKGSVKDHASEKLDSIRLKLSRKRLELRKTFDKVLSKFQRVGYVAESEESFLNGRRVLAVFAEHKRQIKGIIHGESDTRKTSFVEPEETVELNNEVFTLENDERHEQQRILKELVRKLSLYATMLENYHKINGEFDFVEAKARLALLMNAEFPVLRDEPLIRLVRAYHPLLLLYNRKNGKETIPVDLELNSNAHILVISGPNAGGKTVTLKTVGLLQLMLQGGLLVPVHPHSEFGIFKQLMIHIGDTQSLEFELSTYSAHLLNMKYFMENATERTLFFIDELGSGSDPSLGGAFAEVILEFILQKKAFGIVTTHYLNLKVMASKTPGIINGAMSFDEGNLRPLYRLIIGKPGSSYTFSIAERIGLDEKLIAKARTLVDEGHFQLDKLLNRTEQGMLEVEEEKQRLSKLVKENEALHTHMMQFMNKEQHQRRVELLRHQNQLSNDRIAYLKDMERKLKQIVFEWRQSKNKSEVFKQMQSLLFKQKEQQVAEKVKKKFDSQYVETGEHAKTGAKVMMKKNHQVGIIKEIRSKTAVVQVGTMPITVQLGDLVVVKDKDLEKAE